MRSTVRTLFIAPVLVLAAACSKDKAPDPALNNDLGLAAQAGGQARLDSITAAERTNAAMTTTPAPVAVAPAPAPAKTTTVHHTTTTHHTASSGTQSSGSSSSGSVAAAPAPHEVVEKNTKRDAAIGAGAGAILGGVVGHGGVKGAVIGGVAGGILGGVLGNNVDVKKKKVP